MGSKLVLLVDGDADTRAIYSDILSYSGFGVVQACGGAEALELLDHHTADLVISEVRLPGMSGCDFLRRIKVHGRAAGVPVLVVTTDYRDEVRSEAESIGCAAFLFKPCSPLDLVEIVRSITDGNRVHVPA